MAVNRIYYALSAVLLNNGGGWYTIGGVQSAGVSSTVNLETFSSFGTLETSTAIQDADFEITFERLLGSDGGSILNYLAPNVTPAPDVFLGFNSLQPDANIQVALVYNIPATSATGNATKSTIRLNCVPSSYSMNMGLDGGLVESLTFQNAGTDIVYVDNTLSSYAPYEAVIDAGLASLITRRNFGGVLFNPSPNTGNYAIDPQHVQSVSCSMEFSTEKLNALGNSMPIAKYATYPIECSMEIEEHIDPATNFFSSPVSVAATTVAGEVVTLVDQYYSPIIQIAGSAGASCSTSVNTYHHHYWQLNCARMTSRNQSGGDVGGGNVTMSTSFTGYNNLLWGGSTTSALSSITTQPAQSQHDNVEPVFYPPTTPDPTLQIQKTDGYDTSSNAESYKY